MYDFNKLIIIFTSMINCCQAICYFNMAQRNQFVDDILSNKTSLIHLLDSNDDEDNKEAHVIKHSPYNG